MKKVASVLCAVILGVPFLVAADVPMSQQDQLVSLYTQLIDVLKQEILLLQAMPRAALAIEPTTGKAPLDVVFTGLNLSGTEAIDYGDGYSTGSMGCARNAQGWCDLSLSKTHTYRLPANYVVSLYSHPTPTTQKLIGTTTITVTP